MKLRLLLLACSIFAALMTYSQNLALTGVPTASASSLGNFGPSNWNNGIVHGSFFWMGGH